MKITQKEIQDVTNLPVLQAKGKKGNQILYEREDILKYLISNKYIKKGITHSAWEQQTYEHLTTKTKTLSEGICLGFGKRFYQSMRNLPKDSPNQTLGFVISSFKDTLYLSKQDFFSKTPKTNKEDFIEEVNSWKLRMNSQPFHGGSFPDKADFYMYSCLEAYLLFTKPLFFPIPEIWAWKTSMDRLVDQESTYT